MEEREQRVHRPDSTRKQILVVDDELTNRMMLENMLSDEFDVLFANNGAEAIEQMRTHCQTLSLVLLDLIMPVMSGLDVLRSKREEPSLRQIPVIVVTADSQSEAECLELGAVDFIPKPYDVHVTFARIRRIIELYEDRRLIRSTERDALTGLLNKDYFYQYAERYDQLYPDEPMDAILVDVNHFHTINERYGKAYGDRVLKQVGRHLLETVAADGGIACRREGDIFLLYCPHREDYREMIQTAVSDFGEEGDERSSTSRVRLRMGVYPNVDKRLDVEQRFDRANMAAETVRTSITRNIGIYDNALLEQEVFNEQLIEDFPAAIAERQFKVFYQPKFRIQGAKPRLTSAEALVRWEHPKLGNLSPGRFIPLFEENGMVQELDRYVWREAARQVHAWKETLGIAVPVSVNVSRVDMYDPELVSCLQGLVREYGLSYQELCLEVTESAYTQDSQQIIAAAARLRKIGFHIEMDDFGTGYSSLNMLSSLPIDALKLDMQFIRSAFREDGDTHLLKVVIDLARHMRVPVIAEGVETQEQLQSLKELGCDIAQGYYFSKPVSSAAFENLLRTEQREREDDSRQEALREPRSVNEIPPTEEEEARRAENAEIPAPPEKGHGVRVRTFSVCFLVLTLLCCVIMLLSDIAVQQGHRDMQNNQNRYVTAREAGSSMEAASDYLTDRVRCFVVTGDQQFLEDFFEELHVTQRRDKALADLRELAGANSIAYADLAEALDVSNHLVDREYRAMRLTLEAQERDLADMPPEIAAVALTAEESALSAQEKREKAQQLVFDSEYIGAKDRIYEGVRSCSQELVRLTSRELEKSTRRMTTLVWMQTGLIVFWLLAVIMMMLFIYRQMQVPLQVMVDRMKHGQPMQPMGASDLRFVAKTYNEMLGQNREVQEELVHAARHDGLTGLLNKGAYEMMMQEMDIDHIALILLDIDYYKKVNDTYGHDMGDRVLKHMADVLRQNFRSVDVLCRVGGDEFVVIMTRVDSSMRDLALRKVETVSAQMMNPPDDLPPVTLSVGIAFGDRENPKGDIFKDADTALYRVKEAGRNGCEIY